MPFAKTKGALVMPNVGWVMIIVFFFIWIGLTNNKHTNTNDRHLLLRHAHDDPP